MWWRLRLSAAIGWQFRLRSRRLASFLTQSPAAKLVWDSSRLKLRQDRRSWERNFAKHLFEAELDVVIVSILRGSGESLFNPAGDAIIESGDILIPIGQVESLERLN